ncbi:cytochrome d ubiquinol oxidase subunit II [Phenylobacterium sp. LjRoot219]|uniref:cytochrome d ubiquinol oxidase subunit II n=1 Tax=Phenylobacterium sp. LjRoot219 TaxID=3342283 RepID=UPI003ECEA708
MNLDLPLIWGVVIAVAVLMYVLLDGFDLGVGALFPFASDEERDVMTASIAPVWDGNETWLVLGGGGLFAAFPLAYSILMPAFYMPIILMLAALIFRGVAFEFRAHGRRRGRSFWTWAFSIGSIVATIAQGFVLGAFVQGVTVSGRSFAGGPLDWLTPFSVLTSASLTLGYMLLGATWLIGKTEGDLHDKTRRWARWLAVAVAIAMALVSLATLSASPEVTARWGVSIAAVDWGRLLPLTPAPLLGAAGLALVVFAAGRARSRFAAYLGAAAAFLSGYAGLAISIAPYAVPYEVTLWQAAAHDNALALLLVGVVILLPMILSYTAYVYWVFRGKASADHSY